MSQQVIIGYTYQESLYSHSSGAVGSESPLKELPIKEEQRREEMQKKHEQDMLYHEGKARTNSFEKSKNGQRVNNVQHRLETLCMESMQCDIEWESLLILTITYTLLLNRLLLLLD